VVSCAGAALLLSLPVAIAAWLLAPVQADAFGLSPRVRGDAVDVLRLAVPAALAAQLAGLCEGALVGLSRLASAAVVRLTTALVLAGGTVLAVEAGTGLRGVTVALLGSRLVAALSAAAFVRHACGGLLGDGLAGRAELRRVFSTALAKQSSRLGTIVGQQYERLLAGTLLGAAVAASLGAASMLAGGLAGLLIQATLPLSPHLATAAAAGERELGDAYARAAGRFAVVAASCFGALAAIAEPAVEAWLAPT